MQKEQWSTQSFNTICWERNKTALKRISKALQAKRSKMCHNLWHTGARREQWYGKAKPLLMCGNREYWGHVLTCTSLDAELIKADSWSKLSPVLKNPHSTTKGQDKTKEGTQQEYPWFVQRSKEKQQTTTTNNNNYKQQIIKTYFSVVSSVGPSLSLPKGERKIDPESIAATVAATTNMKLSVDDR
jgi:hypothetical protein